MFISAGFDGHGLDVVNHGFFDLDEDDYRWVTEELVKIANTCCEGRIVSVLEGGYSIKGGIVSALGLSVAAHVRALHRANKETWVSSSNASDTEKMALKTKVQEEYRQYKRKRRQIRSEKDHINLSEFMQTDFGNMNEDSENDSNKSVSGSSRGNLDSQQDSDQGEDLLGNRTIE